MIDPAIIVSVVIMVILLIYAVRMEMDDLTCGSLSDECFEGNGKYYAPGKANPNDSISQSLDKINYLAKFQTTAVKWRRALIVSTSCALAIILMVPILRRSHQGIAMQNIFIVFILIFVGVYALYNFYEYHVDAHVEGFIQENVAVIKKHLNIPTEYPVFATIPETIAYIKAKPEDKVRMTGLPVAPKFLLPLR